MGGGASVVIALVVLLVVVDGCDGGDVDNVCVFLINNFLGCFNDVIDLEWLGLYV